MSSREQVAQTVKGTGARAGSVLVGAEDVNRGLRVRVRDLQPPGRGGRVTGPFQVLTPGQSYYARQLIGFTGRWSSAAASVIDKAVKAGGPKGRHILDCTMLKCENDADRITSRSSEVTTVGQSGARDPRGPARRRSGRSAPGASA